MKNWAEIHICLRPGDAEVAHVGPRTDKLTEVVQEEAKGNSENVEFL